MSKKRRIEGDRWDGLSLNEWMIDDASVSDFDAALDRLDASTFTNVMIAGDGEEHMGIGGGAGRYIVYATFDNEDFWNLMRNEPATGTVLLNTGGQVGDYPASQVVTVEQARTAGRTFLLSGKLDPGLRWEKQ
jgi:hypothetical protein